MWADVEFVVTTRVPFRTWIWPTRLYWLGQEVVYWFQCWSNSFCVVGLSNNLSAIDVKTHDSVLEKNTIYNFGTIFQLDWNPRITSTFKTASKKIGALIRSMKLFSLEVIIYFYKSTIQPCMSVLVLLTAT